LAGLTEAAERLDGLAEMADIMNDPHGADQLRAAASTARLRAMTLLDESPTD
jgi:hypothetical protein